MPTFFFVKTIKNYYGFFTSVMKGGIFPLLWLLLHPKQFSALKSITQRYPKSVKAIAQETFVPCAAGVMVEHLQAIALSGPLALRWRMGQKIALTEEGITGVSERQKLMVFQTPAEPVRIIDASTGEFLGISEIRSVPSMTAPPPATGNILAPKMVFAPV